MCLEVTWCGGGLVVHKGHVTNWEEVVAQPALAAVRRVAEVSVGPFSAVYEVDTVTFSSRLDDHLVTQRRTTRQYLVEENSQRPRQWVG